MRLLERCAAPMLAAPGPAESELAAVQARIMRNYFRLARAHEQLKHPHARAAAWLSRELEMERARLARELHAGCGQALAGIRIHLDVIRTLMPDSPESVRTSLDRIGLLAHEALQQVRSVSHRMHPPEWQHLHLEDALRDLWEVSGVPERFATEFTVDHLPCEPVHAIRTALYRAAQEGLTNVIRHSEASRVTLRLTAADGWVRLEVADDGKGFAVDQVLENPRAQAGIGLRSMREQVARLNGRLEIHSSSAGTRLSLTLPLRGIS